LTFAVRNRIILTFTSHSQWRREARVFQLPSQVCTWCA